MKMRRNFLQLWTRCDGAIGAEFALVSPVLLLFLLGIIDVGRYMWEINQLEKATQIGARWAVVTDMVPTDLASANYGLTLGQGASIPPSSFGEAQCEKPSGTVTCTCTVTPCPALTTFNTAAFDAVVARMAQIAPVAASNITVTYTNSGLGYAGDPNGPDVAPIVTVRAHDVAFAPLIFELFGASTKLPAESASLTLEDASGTTSN
jgi:Flp pilus assembly protein TadG